MGSGKLAGLAVLLERFGGAVRADLARYYGMNLNALFRGELTPDEVWDLLQHLPRDSALTAAIADDDDFAAPSGPARLPRLTEFSPEIEALAGIYDLLASLLAVVTALGGQPAKIPPYPRPQTAAARADKAAARAFHEDLVKRLIPGTE